jgi:glycosyltransferase involved in cell wall biosynthesis
VWFLLVGDGPLRSATEKGFAEANLISRTVFAGLRSDVAQLMQAAMDVLLFPSLFEGLPLVLLESQAAGLPAVISDVISEETDVLVGLFRRLPLSVGPEVWAEAILALARSPRPLPDKTVAMMARTAFNAQVSAQKLIGQYSTCRSEQGMCSL